jgi:hypothetical protein
MLHSMSQYYNCQCEIYESTKRNKLAFILKERERERKPE